MNTITKPDEQTFDLTNSITRWLTYQRNFRGLKASSIERYRTTFIAIVKTMERLNLHTWEDLNSPKLLEFYKSHLEHGSPERLEGDIKVLSIFFRWLREIENRKIVPALLKYRAPIKVKLIRSLTTNLSNELDEAIASLELKPRLLFALLIGCGLRLQEVADLRVKNFRDDGFLLVRGKGDVERLVPIPEFVKEVWSAHKEAKLRNFSSESPLFFGYYGALTCRGLRDIFSKSCQKMALEYTLTPHMLRHTYATRLLGVGVDIQVISKLLGHSSVDSTQVYLKLRLDEIREGYEKFELSRKS